MRVLGFETDLAGPKEAPLVVATAPVATADDVVAEKAISPAWMGIPG